MGWALWPMGSCLWSKILRQGYGKCCELPCLSDLPTIHQPEGSVNHCYTTISLFHGELSRCHWTRLILPQHTVNQNAQLICQGYTYSDVIMTLPWMTSALTILPEFWHQRLLSNLLPNTSRLFSRGKACEVTHWWWVIGLCFSNEWIWSIKWLKNGGLSFFLLSTWTGRRQWPMSPQNSNFLQVGKFRNAG